MLDIVTVVYVIIALLVSFHYADVFLARVYRAVGIGRRLGWGVVIVIPLCWVAAMVPGLFWPVLSVLKLRNKKR